MVTLFGEAHGKSSLSLPALTLTPVHLEFCITKGFL